MHFANQLKKSGLCAQNILELFKQYRLSADYRSKKIPKSIYELPKDHFVVKLLQNPNARVKTSELMAFISPDTLLNLYNKEFKHQNCVAAEIYFHFETTEDYYKLRNMSAQQVFHAVKNQDLNVNPEFVKQKCNEIMQCYLGKINFPIHEKITKDQFGFVIPKGYFPLVSMKIVKTSKSNDKRSQSKYVLLRFDEYKSSRSVDQNGFPKEFELLPQQSPIKKNLIIDRDEKPRELLKKEELKIKYSIRNFSLGWFQRSEQESSKIVKPEAFQLYFEIQKINQNLKPLDGKRRNFTYLLTRKSPQQAVRLQIITIFFNELVLKLMIKLSDVKRVDFNTKNKKKEIYLSLKHQPQYFIHFMQYNGGQSIFNLKPWERVENFPVQYQEQLADSLFLRNLISADSTICIDLATSKNEFGKVIEYFQAQEMIECSQLNSSPYHKILTKKTESYICGLQDQFASILSDVTNEFKITVHCIKFSLNSLKCLYGAQITFEDMIRCLERIEKEGFSKIQQHNMALKMLCMKPHELLSKKFENVYAKIIMKLDLWEKLREKWPNIQQSEFLKLQQMLDIDDQFDEASTIQCFEESFLDENSEILKMFTTKIQTIKLILLPRIKLTPNGLVHAGWTKEVASKVLKHYKDFEWQFMKCELRNDDNKQLKKSPYMIQYHLRNQMSKIKILNHNYLPLGWSQSQLREGILWYTLDSKELNTVNRQEILQFLGDFDEKKHKHLVNPALKAARIGQNFGSSWSFDASAINFRYEDDIFADVRREKNFSDGIGCISANLMLHYQESLGLEELSAIQIRYKGIKGLLSINKELPENTAVIRKSMVKYECQHPESVRYFDIIEVSRYKVGYLNRQIIMLLIQNGINSEYIYDLQKQYVDDLTKSRILEIMLEHIAFDDENEEIFERQGNKMFESVAETIKMIMPKSLLHKEDALSKIITEQSFFKALKVQAKKKLIQSLKQKCRIRVEKSVRLFGILDEFKVLGEYEVYCSIQKPKHQNKFNVKGKCVLTKNPCMHPADLRVVTCVSDEEIQKRLQEKGKDSLLFEGILNVIVFPQQGKTPLTMEISQSDLDGDEFFLSWDQRIVPYKNLPPFVIAERVDFEERSWTKAGYEEMLDFFVQYLNFDQLGRLSNSHLVIGDIKGASCEQCIELCKYHSIAVQYPKRGYFFSVPKHLFYNLYPHYMQKQHPIKSYYSTSILGKLYNSVITMTVLSHDRNDFQIFLKSKDTYADLVRRYVNLEDIRKLNVKLEKKGEIRINDILEKHLPDFYNGFVDNQKVYEDQIEEPEMVKNAEEQQIQDQTFFKRKMVPFSIKTLKSIRKFINENPEARQLDNDSPFSLIQILTVFNHLCVYQYDLKSLTDFLEGINESSYTVYFELHTSQSNTHNLPILQRINEFRQKWFYFFAQELAADGIVKSVEDFENLYFKDLIEKKPKFQDTVKSLRSMKGKGQKLNFKHQVNEIVNEFDDCDPQFIKEEIDIRKIIKSEIHYDVFRFSELRDLDPLIYRKLVLYFIVSTYFDKITGEGKMSKILDLYSEYQRPEEGLSFNRVSSRSQKFEEFRKAMKIFNEKKADLLGFCWFCLPKLMVVWWRDIVKMERAMNKE